MQTVDRHGVRIEQCQGCRGLFLDRGELEQIANAERSFYTAPPPHYSDSPPPYGAQPHGGQYGRGDRGHDPRYHSGHYRDSPPPYGHSGHGRRKKSFLEGLFD
jgi:uncharacterized protein